MKAETELCIILQKLMLSCLWISTPNRDFSPAIFFNKANHLKPPPVAENQRFKYMRSENLLSIQSQYTGCIAS